jgi:hypothetical protein
VGVDGVVGRSGARSAICHHGTRAASCIFWSSASGRPPAQGLRPRATALVGGPSRTGSPSVLTAVAIPSLARHSLSTSSTEGLVVFECGAGAVGEFGQLVQKCKVSIPIRLRHRLLSGDCSFHSGILGWPVARKGCTFRFPTVDTHNASSKLSGLALSQPGWPFSGRLRGKTHSP